LEKRTNNSYFDPKKWIGYDNDEIYHKYLTLPEMSALIGDEAARFAMGEDWNKYENKELKKNLMQLRPRHLAFFLNLPRFSWFDSKYKGELIRLWCWVVSRGVALVFEPDENQALTDPWHLDEMKKIKKRITPFTEIDVIHKTFSRHPCFMDIITFPAVPKDIYDRYMEIRTQYIIGLRKFKER